MARVRVVRAKVEPVTTDVLEKKKIRIHSVEPELATLAVRARTLLGYNVLHNAVKVDKALAKALRKLHIRPYTMESVKEYQKGKAAELRAQRKFRYAQVHWNARNITSYDKPIPEFVLEKALQIKDAVPDVEFMVEELTVHPDPFLIAVLGKERYYIEVWNEPKFEAKVIDGNVFRDDDDDDGDV